MAAPQMAPLQSKTGYDAPTPNVMCWLLLLPMRLFFSCAIAPDANSKHSNRVVSFFMFVDFRYKGSKKNFLPTPHCSLRSRCTTDARAVRPYIHRPFRCFAPQRPAYNKVKPAMRVGLDDVLLIIQALLRKTCLQ